jgi:hypothetical protein
MRNRETEALPALNCFTIARLNEAIIIFTMFIKCAEGNFISCFDIFPNLQKFMANLGPLRANKHAETLMQAVSERFSQTMDGNIIFICCLVTPIGKKYSGIVQRPSAFAASTAVLWKQGVDTLGKAFSYDIAQIINLFQDYFDNPRQFGSVKGLYSNYQRYVSIASQRFDNRSFLDFMNRIEAFPATNGHVKNFC